MHYVCIDEKNGEYEVVLSDRCEGFCYSEKFEKEFSAVRRMKMLRTYSADMLKELTEAKGQKFGAENKRSFKPKESGLSPKEELDRILRGKN